MPDDRASQLLTPTIELELHEREWSARLQSVSLTAEYQLNPGDGGKMLDALALLYRRQHNNTPMRERILRRYPAVQVLVTTSAAVDMYDRKGFWPKFAAQLGIRNTGSFQREWGEAFIDNLETLGLPTFKNAEADAGTKYLGRILLHCGVPTFCLDDYYRIITEKRLKNPGIDAGAFVLWAAKRAELGRLYNVDMPVNRFLRFGGEFVVDVTERVFELLDAIAAGGDGAEVQLPERFRLSAIRMRDAGVLESARAAGIRSTRSYPHLELDPYGRGPLLQLPCGGESADGRTVWVVTLDGATQRITSEAAWPGSTEATTWVTVPIPRPIRVASAVLEGRESLIANVQVVDDDDPVLIFDETGILIPKRVHLPRASVWMLFPGVLSDLIFEGEERIIAELPLPPGWSQWSLALVDLEHVRTVRSEHFAMHCRVRSLAGARIEVGERLAGVQTRSGAPVFARLPEIILPEGSGSNTDWVVKIADSDGNVVASGAFGWGESANGLWSDVTRPVLGAYSLNVRGPWGRGAMRSVVIAEGLTVESTPAWRRLTRDGLVRSLTTITTGRGIEVSKTRVEFDSCKRSELVEVRTRDSAMTVQITVPHMSTSYQSTALITEPSIHALTLYTEDVIEDPGTLILNVGADAQPRLSVFAGSQQVQSLLPGPGRQGVYRFDLKQLTDTLRVRKHLSIGLGEETQLPIADIRPRTLFTSVHVVSNGLVFVDCPNIARLVAVVYATRAPWKEPAVCPISGGRAILPDHLREAGPLRVSLRIEDPWAPAPISPYPEARTSVLVDQAGWLQSEDPEETAVSAFLANEGRLPEEVEDFTRLWSVLASLDLLGLDDRRAIVRSSIEAAMHRRPTVALVSLSKSSVPTDAIPYLLVYSGLVWADATHVEDSSAPRWTNRNALPAALLLATDAEQRLDEIDSAIEFCGDLVPQILDGTDPHAGVGRVDGGAEKYAHDTTQREAMTAEMALIPHGLLSSDSRVIALMELFQSFDDGHLQWLIDHGASISLLTSAVLRDIAPPEVVVAYESRKHPTRDDGLRTIPAISIGFALVSRYAARGSRRAKKFIGRQRRAWVSLARVAPKLVTIDIILAELLIAGAGIRSKVTS